MPDSTVRPLGNLAEEKYSAEDYTSRTAFTYTVSLDQPMKVVGHWYWCAKYFAPPCSAKNLNIRRPIPDSKNHLNAHVRLYNFEDRKFIKI